MKTVKYTILILLLVCTVTSSFALPVSIEQAKIAVERRLERDDMASTHTLISVEPIQSDLFPDPIAYHFQLSPVGYVVTSAETSLPPVIAYSYKSNSTTLINNQNILLDFVGADMEQRIASISDFPQAMTNQNSETWTEGYPNGFFDQWPPVGSTPTEGWLEENWSQSPPYNSYCPMDLIAGSRSVAGCPAVTMGMILNFHKTTNSTRFDDNDDYYHNYNEYYWIDDDYIAHDFPSWAELNSYLDSLDSLYVNLLPLSDLDKAAIVFASGSACKQVYTASVSGTFGVTQAYNAYQRFDFTNCELLDSTSDSIFSRLASNMISANPAHLAIIDAASQYGHNVVVDGYNTDDFFHLNFGWGGSYNGWYQFPLTGMPYSMNVIEGVVLDIGTSTQSIEDDPPITTSDPISLTCSTNPASSSINFELQNNVTAVVNISVFTISGRLVDTIAKCNFEQGEHSFNWQSENSPNGVYVLRAESLHGTDTIKFTIVN